MVVREQIVTIDDEVRRLAYASVGGRATHHNASIQVFADGEGRIRLVWITMLPCNVIVQEVPGMGIEVAAVDSVASMQAIENPKLAEIAAQVRLKLRSVIERT